jgi:hypothetical protein
MSDRKLQFNPEPLKVVSAAQRDVWQFRTTFRCEHEDGRGRCTSRSTRVYWDADLRQGEAFCDRHAPAAAGVPHAR